MNKFKLVAVAAVLAAPITAVVADTAEARRPGLNRLFRVQHTLRAFRKPTVYVYRRNKTYRGDFALTAVEAAPGGRDDAQKTRARGQSAGAGVRQVDARGRVYDPGSMVWFDGGKTVLDRHAALDLQEQRVVLRQLSLVSERRRLAGRHGRPPASVGCCETVPAFAAVTPPRRKPRASRPSDAPALQSETKSVRPPTSAPQRTARPIAESILQPSVRPWRCLAPVNIGAGCRTRTFATSSQA